MVFFSIAYSTLILQILYETGQKRWYNTYINHEEVSIMEKFIPYEKLSKKEKRKIDQAKRQTWGELNPVTRKPENSKAYNRRKSQGWKRELPPNPVTFCL